MPSEQSEQNEADVNKPKQRWSEVRFNPMPKLKPKNNSAYAPTAPLNNNGGTSPVANQANQPTAKMAANNPPPPTPPLNNPPANSATNSPQNNPPHAANAPQNPSANNPTRTGNLNKTASSQSQPPVPTAAEIERLEQLQKMFKARKRRGFFFLFLALFLLMGIPLGLILWQDTRNFAFSFFALSNSESRYLRETELLNNRVDNTFSQAYNYLLTTTPSQLEQGYKIIYTGFGESSTKFLASKSPSLRFDRAHEELKRTYLQLEILSKNAAADLSQNLKTANKSLMLSSLDEVRKNFERAKAELRAAANF